MPSQFRAYNAQFIAGKKKKKGEVSKTMSMRNLTIPDSSFSLSLSQIFFFTNLFRFLFWWDKESTSLWPLSGQQYIYAKMTVL